MKAFFIADRKDEHLYSSYTQIIEELKSQGLDVDDSHIHRTPEQDEMNVEMAYKNNLRGIKNADFVIAEISKLSSGIGFLIASALNEKKPVVVLNNTAVNPKPSKMIKGAQNRLLIYFPYETSAIKDVINKALTNIKQKLDTKFILIIPAEIDRYLEWASKERRMHKAQLVREAVENIIEEDLDYQNYLNSI